MPSHLEATSASGGKADNKRVTKTIKKIKRVIMAQKVPV